MTDDPDQLVPFVRLRAYQRVWLKRELALGEKTHAELAAELGKPLPDIANFATRHRASIAAIREDWTAQFYGLWSVKKEHRIGLLESILDDLEDQLERTDEGKLIMDRNTLKIQAQMAKITRQIAEESGQLRSGPEGAPPPRYEITIHGVDVDQMGTPPEEKAS